MTAPDLQITDRLSPEHESVVRATLPLVGQHIDEIARCFYARMFAAHPELLRDTFNRGNQSDGAQQRALAASVATYATLLVDHDGPSPRDMLARIGHKHASLGITEEQYPIVHEHLMAAIVEVLGADVVTPEVAGAWDAVYWNLASVLIAFEHGLYANAHVAPGDVFRTVLVAARHDDGPDIASFELVARDGDTPLPDFVPGQYASVGARLPDGARQLRQYSLADAPGRGRWRIFVRRVDPQDDAPAGEVSTHLHETVRTGDELQVTLPFGDLTLDVDGSEPVVLISAGVGATPMLGILRYLQERQPERPVTVLHAESREDEAVFATQLGEIVDTYPVDADVRLHVWFGARSDVDPLADGAPGEHATSRRSVRSGRLSIERSHIPEGATCYLCGPAGFLEGARASLAALGVQAERARFELFAPNDWLLPG